MIAPAPRWGDTLAALRAPRRAFPIALIAAALGAGQLAFTRDLGALALALLLVGALVTLAPHAWRRLFGAGRASAPALLRAALYVALGLAVTAALGWALPVALGHRDAFLSAPGSLLLEPALFCALGWGLGRDIELERDPLALIVRDALDAERVARWPLARELEIVKSLCDIHRLRRPDGPAVRVAIEGNAAAFEVPSLALLPLAGIIVTGGHGEVTLAARTEAEGITLTAWPVEPTQGALASLGAHLERELGGGAGAEPGRDEAGMPRLVLRLGSRVRPGAS